MANEGARQGFLAAVAAFTAVAAITTGAGALRPGASEATPSTPSEAAAASTRTDMARPAAEPTTTTVPAPAAPEVPPEAPEAEAPDAATTVTTTATPTTRPAPTTTTTVPPAKPEPKPEAAKPDAVSGFGSILEVAQAQIGGPEARYTSEWGFARGFWCAKFVSWVLAHAGVDIRADGPGDLKWQLQPVTDPRPGDFVFIDLQADQGTGQSNHVAVIESVRPDGTVATIEGNGPDEYVVGRAVRTPAEITGFGRAPAPTLRTLVIPPPAPDCIWIEIGKPWMCE